VGIKLKESTKLRLKLKALEREYKETNATLSDRWKLRDELRKKLNNEVMDEETYEREGNKLENEMSLLRKKLDKLHEQIEDTQEVITDLE
jgi:hypothetical protein